MGTILQSNFEEAPSEAIIFQTVLLNNLPIRYFKMKIFFALALVTCSVVLGVDGECSSFGTDGVTCPCTAKNTSGCSSLPSCSSGNVKYKKLCKANNWGGKKCANSYDIWKCEDKNAKSKGSSTSSTTKKNVAIPKPGTACKSKITFPVKALKGVTGYPLMVEVFGIPIIFGSKFKNSGKVNHIASVMAELLDQDGDGCADDPNVLRNILIKSDGPKNAMVVGNNQAIGVTTAASNAINKKGFEEGQDLYFAEVIPKCSG